MTMYCESCQIAFSDNRCPFCGSKKIRQPVANDPCFLCEKQIVWGEMLEEALKNNDIPVMIKKRWGAGMALKVGPMMEQVRIFVPFSCLEDSKRIASELFSNTDGTN